MHKKWEIEWDDAKKSLPRERQGRKTGSEFI
jgi:hypothetical protein